MQPEEIQARIGSKVSCEDAAEMIRSQPICSTDTDVCVRSGVLSFSFGPDGLVLLDAEQRTPRTA